MRGPWNTAPHGVVSLLDMMEFIAGFFVKKMSELDEFKRAIEQSNQKKLVPTELVLKLNAKVDVFGALCVEYGLNSTAKQCDRIQKQLKETGMQMLCAHMAEALHALHTRFEDDLGSEYFLHLSVQDADMYKNPTKNWDKALGRFWRMRKDVEESSKCFALGRYAAALFHVLLVAEHGVVELAKLLDVAGDKPGWGNLERLEKIYLKKYPDRNEKEKQYSAVIDSTIPFALAIKNAWRHKISHVENKLIWSDTDFSPELTKDILNAVRGFMEKLAAELPKDENKKRV